MMARRQTATAQLERLRAVAVQARVDQREAGVALEGASSQVETIREQIVGAHAEGADNAVAKLTAELAEQRLAVEQASLKADGLHRRVDAADAAVATYIADHHRDLFDEHEPRGLAARDRLAKAATELLEADGEWSAVQTETDDLLRHVPNASPRVDAREGHRLKGVVRELRKAFTAGAELEPPLPTWSGVEERSAEQARVLQLRKGREEAA